MNLDQNLYYQAAWLVLAILAVEAALNYRRPGAMPALVGYGTVGAWYLLEPMYTPEEFTSFSGDIFDNACLEVIGFLIVLRLAIQPFTRTALRNATSQEELAHVPAEKFLYCSALLWLALALWGIYRLDGDVVGALFPLDSRAGAQMWARGAASSAGDSGFLVSSASYLYTLTCASFGILLPFLHKRSARALAVILILVSWPYFLLQGSRNLFLAVFVPTFASYAIFSRQRPLFKAVVALVCFLAIDEWFHLVEAYRNVGFAELLQGNMPDTAVESKHVGLNMMSELCYANSFLEQGLMSVSFGAGYLEEAANVIPRAIWPDKPLIGQDYSMLRGFGGAFSDNGLFATISSGVIGQGVQNFGQLFGPIIAAMLFAAWLALLARFRQQQGSVLRLTLFLLGLGLTFNLGRDLTLLVLWPMIFAYVLVRILESYVVAPRAIRLSSALVSRRLPPRNLRVRPPDFSDPRP